MGGVIIVGGGDGRIGGAYTTAFGLLHHMNARVIASVVYSHNTNNVPSKDDITRQQMSPTSISDGFRYAFQKPNKVGHVSTYLPPR